MRCLVLIAASSGLAVSALAQSVPTLRGTVRDSLGQPLSRVEVSYRSTKTYSDSAGQFSLAPVPLGRITVRFVRDRVLLGELEANITADTTPDVQVEAVGDRAEPRTLRGDVVDENGRPIRDADIDVVTANRSVRSDSGGKFVVRDLPAMRHIVRVRRVGSTPTYLFTNLSDSTSARVRIVVRQFAGQNLGLVVVRANRGPSHLQGFLRRAAKPSGWGQIFTEQQIRARNPIRTSDMFLGLAGVRVNRNAFGSGTLTGRGGCRVSVFINGFLVQPRGGMGIDEMVNALDLAGIEVYNGIGGLPPDLMMGGSNACGTVGIWTK
jgi:Carboxypeptidase regulatory-like domain/TonB-dependent Receptor Plug Domain